jgi:hypothetical protein
MADESSSGDAPVDDFDLPLSSSESGPAPSSSGEPSSGQPASASPSAEPAAAPASTPPAQPSPLADTLRREGLREIPGETADQTYARLTRHLEGKSSRFYADLKASQQAHAEELRQIREYITPLAREHFNRVKAEKEAAAAAEIPDRDDPYYPTWLQEQTLLKLEEREVTAEEQAKIAAAQAEEQKVQEYYRYVDDTGYAALAHGLGQMPGSNPDPELVEAYTTLTNIGYESVLAQFPGATQDQVLEFIENAQHIDIRNWVEQGVDPREQIKERYRAMKARFVPSNGNGSHAAAALPEAPAVPDAATSSHPAKPATPTPSPVAARIAEEAARSARLAPVTAGAPSRPSPAPSAPLDASAFEDEDDFVDAVLAGMVGTEQDRVAKYRKEW